MKLSFLDTKGPADMVKLARVCEENGYQRYWVSEHYSATQSSAPFVAAAAVAQATDQIRVGIAGCLVRLITPARARCEYALLDCLFPDRIDFGMARGVTGSEVLERQLTGGGAVSNVEYVERVRTLVSLLRSANFEPIGIPDFEPGPTRSPYYPPEIWLCGNSRSSATLAAELGIAYAFHHELFKGTSEDLSGPEIVELYRQDFRPQSNLARPTVNIAAFGHCDLTNDSAITGLREGYGPNVSVSFCGDPQTCREQLASLAEEYGVDEVVVGFPIAEFESRVRNLVLLGPNGDNRSVSLERDPHLWVEDSEFRWADE